MPLVKLKLIPGAHLVQNIDHIDTFSAIPPEDRLKSTKEDNWNRSF